MLLCLLRERVGYAKCVERTEGGERERDKKKGVLWGEVCVCNVVCSVKFKKWDPLSGDWGCVMRHACMVDGWSSSFNSVGFGCLCPGSS